MLSSDKWQRLHGVSREFHPRLVDSLDQFRSSTDCRFVVQPETQMPLKASITVSDDDAQFFMERPRFNFVLDPFPKPDGSAVNVPGIRLSRGRDKFILLIRGAEGMIFDHHGIYKNGGFITTVRDLPPWLRREPDERPTFSIDVEHLATIPVLKGTFVVFCDGNVHNYYHWWVDMMAPLDAASRRFPIDGYRLLPGAIHTLRPWQQDALRYMDHGNLYSPDHGVQLIRVEEAVWVDLLNTFPLHYDELAEIRRLATARIGGSGAATKRIYIKRLNNLRAIKNEAVVDSLVKGFGFEPHTLENLSLRSQIELFSQAQVVLANHGAGLANMIFAPANSTVLELMPSVEMRLHYWGLANALGQTHGFVRCPSDSETEFHAPITVDPKALQTLLEKTV